MAAAVEELAAVGQQSMPRRWSCVNNKKNEQFTLMFYCTWSGKSYHVPTPVVGSTSLKKAMEGLKKQDPSLYLMEEYGGVEMHCGENTVCVSEWDETMLCTLVDQPDQKMPPKVIDNGHGAVVITIGSKGVPLKKKASTLTRRLSEDHTYG